MIGDLDERMNGLIEDFIDPNLIEHKGKLALINAIGQLAIRPRKSLS